MSHPECPFCHQPIGDPEHHAREQLITIREVLGCRDGQTEVMAVRAVAVKVERLEAELKAERESFQGDVKAWLRKVERLEAELAMRKEGTNGTVDDETGG